MLLATWGARVLALGLGGALIAACGSSGPQATASATPLSRTQLQARYTAAAAAYNARSTQTSRSESSFCDASSASADLSRCQMALGEDRQTTLSYDSALRALKFTGQAATDVARLLADDATLEGLLEQAATAPSLTAIAQLTGQIFPLLNTTAADASKVRGDLGLP